MSSFFAGRASKCGVCGALLGVMGILAAAGVAGAGPQVAGVCGAASPPSTGRKAGVPGAATGVAGTRVPGKGVLGATSPPWIGTKAGVAGVGNGVATLGANSLADCEVEIAAVSGGLLNEVLEAREEPETGSDPEQTAVAGGGVGVLGGGRPLGVYG